VVTVVCDCEISVSVNAFKNRLQTLGKKSLDRSPINSGSQTCQSLGKPHLESIPVSIIYFQSSSLCNCLPGIKISTTNNMHKLYYLGVK